MIGPLTCALAMWLHLTVLKEAGAATYYLDQKSGNASNNGLSVQSAFQQMKTAVKALRPGDTLKIVGTLTNPLYNSTYSYSQNVNDNHIWQTENTLTLTEVKGQANAWITIAAFDRNTVLKGDGGTIIRAMRCQFLRIHGLNVYGEVEQIPISTAKALQFLYKADNGTVQYRVPLTLTDEEIDAMTLPRLGSTVPRPSYTDTLGIYVSDSDHIVISDNVVHHMPGGGIRASKTEYVDIVGNTVHDCARRTYSGTHALVVTYTTDVLPKEGTLNYRARILRNVVHHNYNEIYSWSGEKVGIHARIDEGKGISLQRNQEFKNGGRILVANNVAFWNGYSGVHSQDGDNIDIVANTCYMNSYTNTVTYKGQTQSGSNIGISLQGGSNCTIYNNIAVIDSSWRGFAISVSKSSTTAVDSNLIHGVGANTLAFDEDFEAIQTNTLVGDPDFFNAPDTDFSISSASSLAVAAANPVWMPCEDLKQMQRSPLATLGALEYGSTVLATQQANITACYMFGISSSP
jgi:parallel beta-helix repeat protein